MARQQSSDLVRMLEQLGGAACTNTLLPLLRADKSAGAFALTCQQLRRLCHDNQRELKLTAANCAHLLDGQAAADVFGCHFAACDDVTLTITSVGDAAGAGLLLSMLARLPSLSSLHLDIPDQAASAACHVMPLVQLVQLQLSAGLRALQLSQHGQGCVGSAPFWAKVGAIPQLSKLVLQTCGASDPDDARAHALTMRHLFSGLAPLGSGLKHLQLPYIEPDRLATQDWSCLAALSSLTYLALPFTAARANFSAVTACSSLQHLQLFAHLDDGPEPDKGPALDHGEWAALAQLTALTGLHFKNVPAPSPDVLGPCLESLSALVELELGSLEDHHLRALASCTLLTGLAGLWGPFALMLGPLAAGTDTVVPICRSVRRVNCLGALPLAAFPGVESLGVGGLWQPARLASLSRHCRQLRHLDLRETQDASLDGSASAAERVAAIRSLSGLQHLASLGLWPNDDAEVAAISCLAHINKLKLDCDCFHISAQALGLLGRMAGLEHLTLEMFAREDDNIGLEQAQLLLIALGGVPSMTVRESTTGGTGIFAEAAAAVRALGLPLPAVCRV